MTGVVAAGARPRWRWYLAPRGRRPSLTPQSSVVPLASPRIVFEDNHLLIVDKPAGMLSQGDETGDPTLLDWGKRYIKQQYDKPGAVYLGLAHRLDRPTSGLVVLCRTSKALARMQPMFAERAVEKTYLAVVQAPVEDGERRLVDYLRHDPAVKRMRVHRSARKAGRDAKRAELTYDLLGRVAGRSLLRVRPLTGRRHQIRAQLAAAGLPIEGDLRYGAKGPLPDRSIGLHALRLRFEHPVGRAPVEVQALPREAHESFRHFGDLLGGSLGDIV